MHIWWVELAGSIPSCTKAVYDIKGAFQGDVHNLTRQETWQVVDEVNTRKTPEKYDRK